MSPVFLSTSYLLLEPLGISMMTLISSGGLLPVGMSCHKLGAIEKCKNYTLQIRYRLDAMHYSSFPVGFSDVLSVASSSAAVSSTTCSSATSDSAVAAGCVSVCSASPACPACA